jgi:hypothetical protein
MLQIELWQKSTIKHLKEVDMTYWEHLKFAWGIAAASFIHGIFPFLLSKYVTEKITGSPSRYRRKAK